MCKKSIRFAFFVLVLGLASTGPVAAAEPGLAGWWAFDEGGGTTAKDSSGNGHDGTIVGQAETPPRLGAFVAAIMPTSGRGAAGSAPPPPRRRQAAEGLDPGGHDVALVQPAGRAHAAREDLRPTWKAERHLSGARVGLLLRESVSAAIWPAAARPPKTALRRPRSVSASCCSACRICAASLEARACCSSHAPCSPLGPLQYGSRRPNADSSAWLPRRVARPPYPAAPRGLISRPVGSISRTDSWRQLSGSTGAPSSSRTNSPHAMSLTSGASLPGSSSR